MRSKPKKPEAVTKLILEEIIGLTTKNTNGFASDASAGLCAYLAGCVVVLYDVVADTRTHLMVSSRVPKPLICVALARKGRGLVAAGESGQSPGILLWDLSTGNLLSDLKGHQYGVQCIDFSADGKILVSLGLHNDGCICVWDLKSGKLSAKVKVSVAFCPLQSVSFLSEENSFITVGKKLIRLWNAQSLKPINKSMGKDCLPVDGKLGCLKGRSFVSVVSTSWTTKSSCDGHSSDSFHTYAVTETGLLCAIDDGFSIKKYVDTEAERAYSLSLSKDLIACGCNNGVVQLYQVGSLLHMGSVKYGEPTTYFGSENIVSETQPCENFPDRNDNIPDAIACQFLSPTRLGVIYADHSFYIWDIDHVQKINKCCILVSHSACIWDIKNLPFKDLDVAGSRNTNKVNLHEISFATCSADGTVRQWDLSVLAHLEGSQEQQESVANQRMPGFLDHNPRSSVQLVSCGILEHGNANTKLDVQAFRTMAISSDGQYLAAGDCSGNLHIFNLHTSTYTCIKAAHRAEIVSLDFSKKSFCDNGEVKSLYLVTGSKDRTIHIYDALRNFDLVESVEDHAAAVTSVILTSDDSKLISCGVDRFIYFRDVLMSDAGCRVLRRHNQSASHGCIYAMAIDSAEKIAVTAGQDRKINKYNISSGKLVSSFKEEGDLGQPVKVVVDPTGSYLACSYSNKSLRIYDFATGEAVGQAMGHAEVITGSVFLPDCKHMISVSGDSCIFIWKLPAALSSKMFQKVKENALHLSQTISSQSTSSLEAAKNRGEIGEDIIKMELDGVPEGRLSHKEGRGVTSVDGADDSTFEFSVSRLPSWARTKVTSGSSPTQEDVTPEDYSSHTGSFKHVELTPKPSSDQDESRTLHGRSFHLKDGAQESSSNNSTGPTVEDSTSIDIKSKELSSDESLAHLEKGLNGLKPRSTEVEVNLTGEREESIPENDAELMIDRALSRNPNATEHQPLPLTAEAGNVTYEIISNDSLSPTLKPVGESTGRKSFSGHFHARRYKLSSCKRSIETLNPDASPDLKGSTDTAAKRVKMTAQLDTNNQGEKAGEGLNPNPNPSCPAEGNEMEGEMDELRKALEHLDIAAETAVSLCMGHASDSLRDEMLRLLDLSLPSISEKVETLSKLVGGGRVGASLSSPKEEALEVGPMLERFAGALSDRVLQLLKIKMNDDDEDE